MIEGNLFKSSMRLKLETTYLVKQITMNYSFVTPQAITGSERNNFNVTFIAMEQHAKLLCVVSSYFAL